MQDWKNLLQNFGPEKFLFEIPISGGTPSHLSDNCLQSITKERYLLGRRFILLILILLLI